jgi:hypothetical protein
MSAQGGTITGRAPMHLPVRAIMILVVAALAATVALGAIQLTRGPAEQANVAGVQEIGWGTNVGHPFPHVRVTEDASTMPMQRLYPGGFVQVEGEASMPVQRLYPGGFVQVEGEASMPVQRLYPGGFVQVEGEASMPVQRLYPGGFVQVDDDQTVLFDGRRRKW